MIFPTISLPVALAYLRKINSLTHHHRSKSVLKNELKITEETLQIMREYGLLTKENRPTERAEKLLANTAEASSHLIRKCALRPKLFKFIRSYFSTNPPNSHNQIVQYLMKNNPVLNQPTALRISYSYIISVDCIKNPERLLSPEEQKLILDAYKEENKIKSDEVTNQKFILFG